MGQSTQARRGAPFADDLIHANYADREIVLAGSDVSAWGDVGSLGTRDFAQADTSKDPNYGVFATNPALVFDGVNDFMASPAINLAPYGSITVAVTLMFTGGTSKMVYETSTSTTTGNWRIFETNATTLSITYRSTTADQTLAIPGLSAGTVYRLIFVLNASGTAYTRCYVNNVSQGTAGTANAAFTNQVHYIGMRAGTSLPWPGKLGDMFIYGRALTVGEIGDLDAWMAPRAA